MDQTQPGNIKILYHDEDIVCINKPAGILSIQDGYNPALPHLKFLLCPSFGELWIVHRLDKDTSGAMILARNKSAHRTLNIQFETRQIKKKYLAIVLGTPIDVKFIINLPLQVNGDRQHRTVISDSKGKLASTEIVVLAFGEVVSFVEAYPYNGYTHQIRAHLANSNLPILSDALYQRKSALPSISDQIALIPRLALHASTIQFNHPRTDQPLSYEAPLPLDILQVLDHYHL